MYFSMIEKDKVDKLQAPLPAWAVKAHPTKTYLSVINPMAVIDRLNEVFGMGAWDFKVKEIHHEKETNAKGNTSWVTASHGTLIVKEYGVHIEQFGGSDNADLGDAYKGSATDALTKCASYLGIGASIYKGQGNTEPPKTWSLNEALRHVGSATDETELTKLYRELPASLQKDNEVIAKCKEVKEGIQEIINQ